MLLVTTCYMLLELASMIFFPPVFSHSCFWLVKLSVASYIVYFVSSVREFVC